MKATPNPYSPYATADPQTRHIFRLPAILPPPEPGALLPTACEAMAVVSEQVVQTEPGASLPDGMCFLCVVVMNGGEPPARPTSRCGTCGSSTWHQQMCAVCRQEQHEAWWPTRTTSSARGDRPQIENTSASMRNAGAAAAMLGAAAVIGADTAIGLQERAGQEQFVRSEMLPTELKDDQAAFEALGIVFGAPPCPRAGRGRRPATTCGRTSPTAWAAGASPSSTRRPSTTGMRG